MWVRVLGTVESKGKLVLRFFVKVLNVYVNLYVNTSSVHIGAYRYCQPRVET
jgi:hypothetical protein